jgi:hypothetical protein
VERTHWILAKFSRGNPYVRWSKPMAFLEFPGPRQVVESEPLLKPDPESPSSPSQRGLVRKAFAVYLAAGAPAVMLAMELAAWRLV